jgi:sugar phosphate isomerase/epimerase
MDLGFTIGIHPHLYKSIGSIREADTYLQKFPQLKLIADTAHLHLAGDDVLEALERYGDRVVAVHLKDWTSRFGRSPFRFARGFSELGRGDLRESLLSVVTYLQRVDYRGWIIVEQDTPNGSPVDSARISREWLNRQGL